jgi:hypothetical protein
VEHIMNLAPLWKLYLIINLAYSAHDPVRTIKSGLEPLSPTLLQRSLSAGLESQENQISNLKVVLYPMHVRTYLFSVLCRLQVLFQQLENLLTLYDPILSLGSSSLPEDQVYQSGSIIYVQCSEGCHTNGHVVGGVVAMFS